MNQNTNQAYFLTAAGLRVLISPAIIHLILIHQLCAPSAAQVTEAYEVVGSQKPVRAEVGDDVVLPCKVEPPLDVTTRTVEWKCNKTVVHMYKSRSDNPGAQDKKFRTRTSLFRDEMSKGNISLKLVQVNETDAGIYTCYVRKLHDKVKSSTVTLIVAPGWNIDGKQHGNPTTKPKPENSNWYYLLILIIPIVVAVFWTTIRNNKRYKSPNDQGTVKTGQVDDTDPSDNAGNNMENTNITGQNCRGRKAQTGTVW